MPLPLLAAAFLKKVAITLGIVLIIIALVYGVKLYNKYQKVKSQVNIASSYPPLSSKDGRYLYKVNFKGAETTTKMVKIEAFLDGNENYEKTSSISVEPRSGSWTTVDNGKTKEGSGSKTDALVFYYDMDGANIATSFTKIDLDIDIEFKFETFFRDFHPVLGFTFDVPGPYDTKLTHFKDTWTYSGSIVTEEDLEDWDSSLTGDN